MTDAASQDEHGPVELLVLSFPGEEVGAEVRAALLEVLERGDVTLLDLTLVARKEDGSVRVVELEEHAEELAFLDLTIDQALLSDEDVEAVVAGLAPGTSAVLLVFEHRWARRLAIAVRAAGGQVEFDLRIPPAIAAAAFA